MKTIFNFAIVLLKVSINYGILVDALNGIEKKTETIPTISSIVTIQSTMPVISSVINANCLVTDYRLPLLKTFSDNIVLPNKQDSSCIHQNSSDGACALYSVLGAALQLDDLRKKLSDMVVNQEHDFVDFKVTTPQPDDSISFDTTKVAKKFHSNICQRHYNEYYMSINNMASKIFRVKKEIHRGGMIPSTHPFINLLTKAYYEYQRINDKCAIRDYNVFGFINDDVYCNLFGSMSNMIYTDRIYFEPKDSKDPTIKSISNGLILAKNGEIIEGSSKNLFGNSNNYIFSIGCGGHARSIYYNGKEWLCFDNQGSNCGSPCHGVFSVNGAIPIKRT